MPRNMNTIPGGTSIKDGETIRLNPNGTTWESHKFATTKADVGLGNVDNTSDADKPVSILTQAELDSKVDESSLADVAFSGDYSDLHNKPTIPSAQVNSDWNSTSGISAILNKPTLSTVATSGSYSDLSNKPTIPAAQVNADWNATSGVAQIANKPTLATVATTGSYNDLTNKPTGQVKHISLSGTTDSNGEVSFDVSSAGFTSLSRGGINAFVSDIANTYGYAVTSISNTSVTIRVNRRTFTGVTVVGLTVLGAATMSPPPTGTTVYAGFTGV